MLMKTMMMMKALQLDQTRARSFLNKSSDDIPMQVAGNLTQIGGTLTTLPFPSVDSTWFKPIPEGGEDQPHLNRNGPFPNGFHGTEINGANTLRHNTEQEKEEACEADLEGPDLTWSSNYSTTILLQYGSGFSLKVFEKYGYNYLREIILRRADYQEYKISEKDFKNLHPNDFDRSCSINIQEKHQHLPKKDKIVFNSSLHVDKKPGGQEFACSGDLQLGDFKYQLEVNEIYAEKIAKNANPLALVAARQYPNIYYQAPKYHKSYAPPSKQSSSTRSVSLKICRLIQNYISINRYRVLRDFLLHRSSINNSASLSNKFKESYFIFKIRVSGLLHQVITAIADRIRDSLLMNKRHPPVYLTNTSMKASESSKSSWGEYGTFDTLMLSSHLNRGSSLYYFTLKKYDMELLKRAHMLNFNPTRILVDTESKLVPKGTHISDPTLYRSLAGGLQYLTFTHHDLSYGTLEFGLQLYASLGSSLMAYFDIDWVGCPCYSQIYIWVLCIYG
ncbi:ribonuclease H-like domain-containing protein [Tanacetum coccineum]